MYTSFGTFFFFDKIVPICNSFDQFHGFFFTHQTSSPRVLTHTLEGWSSVFPIELFECPQKSLSRLFVNFNLFVEFITLYFKNLEKKKQHFTIIREESWKSLLGLTCEVQKLFCKIFITKLFSLQCSSFWFTKLAFHKEIFAL